MKPPTKAQLARADRKDRIVTVAREIAEVDGWSAVTVRRLADAIGFSQPVLYGHFPDGRDGIVRAVALAGFARIATVLQGADPDGPVNAPQPAPGDWWWSTEGQRAGGPPPEGREGADQQLAGDEMPAEPEAAAAKPVEGDEPAWPRVAPAVPEGPDGRSEATRRATPAVRERLQRLAERYLDFARQHPAVYEAMFSLPTDLAFATAAAPPELRAGFGALAAVAGDEIRAEMLWSALHGLADLGRHGRLRAGHGEERIGLLVDLFAPDELAGGYPE